MFWPAQNHIVAVTATSQNVLIIQVKNRKSKTGSSKINTYFSLVKELTCQKLTARRAHICDQSVVNKPGSKASARSNTLSVALRISTLQEKQNNRNNFLSLSFWLIGSVTWPAMWPAYWLSYWLSQIVSQLELPRIALVRMSRLLSRLAYCLAKTRPIRVLSLFQLII